MLEDWRTAPIPEHLRAVLGFLDKLTLAPNELGPDDLAPLRAAGVSDGAIADAIHVCAIFNLIDRVADALGFEVPPPDTFERGAKALLARGYRF